MEKHVEGRLKLKVQRKGGMCLKWSSANNRGVPDRIVLMPNGKIYFVETKVKSGGVISPQQKKVHKLMANLGIPVHVIFTIEQAEVFVDGI